MQGLIDQFLLAYQGRLRASTLRDYRSILQLHISPFASFEQLNQDLETYLSVLATSGKRKNNILSATRTFVAWARRRGLYGADFSMIPRFPHRSKKTRPLSPEEARMVMDFSPPPYKDFFQVCILTGFRTSEALNLKFKDFDLAGRRIMIRDAKTPAGDRDFPLLRPLWEIYERRRQANRRGSAWFFYSPFRGRLSLGAIRRVWREVLNLFEIKPRILYATRHTFASLAVAAGEDPLWIAEVMGHSRPDQLFLRYASYLEGVKDDGAKFLDLALGRGSFLRLVK